MNLPSLALSHTHYLANQLLKDVEDELQAFLEKNIQRNTRQQIELLLASPQGTTLKKMIVYSMIVDWLVESPQNRRHQDHAILEFDSISEAATALDQFSQICDFVKNNFSVMLTITRQGDDKNLFCNF